MRFALTLMTAVLLAGTGAAQPAPATAASSPDPEQQLFRLLNLERQHHGLGLFQWDSRLADAARVHAQKMARAGDISHRFAGEPDLAERARRTGTLFKAVAENVALAGTPEEVHLALMNSPGHRANILNPDYNSVGVGVTQVNNELYVTEDFAHVVPNYSAEQFRQGIADAFNKARQARGLRAIAARGDTRLDQAACLAKLDPGSVLADQPGASSATTFTAVQPWDLPSDVEKSAGDSTVQRMSLGICFRPDPASNFAQFWVVAVFFANPRSGQRTSGPLLPVTR